MRRLHIYFLSVFVIGAFLFLTYAFYPKHVPVHVHRDAIAPCQIQELQLTELKAQLHSLNDTFTRLQQLIAAGAVDQASMTEAASTLVTISNQVAHADSVMQKQQKPKIAIVTFANANLPFRASSFLNKLKYATRHGYALYAEDETKEDRSRPPAWSKIPAIKHHLADHDWVFWTDADSIIMNADVRLEDLIDANYDLVISEVREWNGEVGVNTGNFLIKNSEQSFRLLDAVWNQVADIEHPWWEQQGMRNVFKYQPHFKNSVKIVPQKTINAFPSSTPGTSPIQWYEHGDFIIHFAGCGSRGTCQSDWATWITQSSVQRRMLWWLPEDEQQQAI